MLSVTTEHVNMGIWMYVDIDVVAMTLDRSPPRSYPQCTFHSIIFARKTKKYMSEGRQWEVMYLAAPCFSKYLQVIFRYLLNWEESTLLRPITQECIRSTLACCLVTWEWLNNYGAAVSSAVFLTLIYILSRRHTPNRLNCSRRCFSSNFNVFLPSVILPNDSISQGPSFFPLTGGRDSHASLRASHQDIQIQNHLEGLLKHR